MNDDDRVRLTHMLEAATEALSFAEGRSRIDLNDDRILMHALVRCIEIIGEAAVNVSREYKETVPEIPWAKLAGMRNRVVHAYFDIDLDIVWDSVLELPTLIAALTDLSLDGAGSRG